MPSAEAICSCASFSFAVATNNQALFDFLYEPLKQRAGRRGDRAQQPLRFDPSCDCNILIKPYGRSKDRLLHFATRHGNRKIMNTQICQIIDV